jgi:hypothetical protein
LRVEVSGDWRKRKIPGLRKRNWIGRWLIVRKKLGRGAFCWWTFWKLRKIERGIFEKVWSVEIWIYPAKWLKYLEDPDQMRLLSIPAYYCDK